jgi:hypothetical protein
VDVPGAESPELQPASAASANAAQNGRQAVRVLRGKWEGGWAGGC